jgi:hypothetical protein
LLIATATAERAINERGKPMVRSGVEDIAQSPDPVTVAAQGPEMGRSPEPQPTITRPSDVAVASSAPYVDSALHPPDEPRVDGLVGAGIPILGDPPQATGRDVPLNRTDAESATTPNPSAEVDHRQLGARRGDDPPLGPPTMTPRELAQAAARWRVARSEAAVDMWDNSTLAGIKIVASSRALAVDPAIEVAAANAAEPTHFERGE